MGSGLWARITGKDKRKKYPDQQGVALKRVGDFTIIYPYGLYCDLPNDSLIREISTGIALPMSIKRPDDVNQGEPVFYHAPSKTRIVARNNGDLEIITNDGTTGNVVIKTVNATVQASGNVNVNAVNMQGVFTGSATFDTPSATFTGMVTVLNGMTVTGAMINNGVNIGSTHLHPAGTPPGNTGPPTV